MGPVPDEIDAVDLKVDGALPPELDGRYFRNGSNPLPGDHPGHDFIGQGMIHGVRLSGGKAAWYRNRWVKTPTMRGAHIVNSDGTWNLTASIANTSVLRYDGAIFALVETAVPYAISAELETVGPYDFCGALKTPMTAHPKRDAATGELYFFGYSLRPPFVTYHVASPDGRLLRSEQVGVTGPIMMHDFAITEHYALFLDLPVVFDRALAGKRGMPFRWSEEYPPRIGIMPRSGGGVRWIPVEPRYAFHVANAHEDPDGRIVLEGVAYDRDAFESIWERLGGLSASSGAGGPHASSHSVLYRWVIEPSGTLVSEGAIDDLGIEFPTIDRGRTGLSNRYAYAVHQPFGTDRTGSAIVKYDRVTGRRDAYEVGEGWIPGEALFVAAAGATSEDEGWLISIVTHATADAAQLVVNDATHLSAPPVAVVHLPRRVPEGFHGEWIPETSPAGVI